MYAQRRDYYRKIEELRESKVVAYVTGDRRNVETQISSEVLEFLAAHLEALGITKRISFLLHTRGGDTLAAWSIVNLLRQYCDDLEVIVPMRAHSAGTLICLGANTIVMTKRATLGPIDPSVNGPLNPRIPGDASGNTVGVNVESVNAYVEFARQSLGKNGDMSSVLVNLAEHIHPLVLGNAFRTRAQIRMLGKRLLAHQLDDENHVKKVLDFLCSESGSHDYTIHHKEAAELLGLRVELPEDALNDLVMLVYGDVADELKLATPFEPVAEIGALPRKSIELRQALLESTSGGSHLFSTPMTLVMQQGQSGAPVRIELSAPPGWRHEQGL
jgi:hypothetical protein